VLKQMTLASQARRALAITRQADYPGRERSRWNTMRRGADPRTSTVAIRQPIWQATRHNEGLRKIVERAAVGRRLVGRIGAIPFKSWRPNSRGATTLDVEARAPSISGG